MDKNFLLSLWYSNSRKVAFGLLLFLVATCLVIAKVIGAPDWMLCVGACTTLIGGGTLADSYFGKKKGPDAPPPTPAA